jgi:hypothetical protein
LAGGFGLVRREFMDGVTSEQEETGEEQEFHE